MMNPFRKKTIKADDRSETDRRAVYDMVQSDGWKMSFRWAMEALKDIKDVRNITDGNDNVEVRARKLFINMLEAHYENIYGIIINNENVNDEDEDSELYSVLKGDPITEDSEYGEL